MSTPFQTPSWEKDSLERLGYHPQFSGHVNEDAVKRCQQMLTEGHLLLQSGRVKEALLIAGICQGLDPISSEAWSLKGSCLVEQKRFSQALECYQKAFELNPGSHLDHFKIAYLKQQLAHPKWTFLGGKIKPSILALSILVGLLFGSAGAFWMLSQKSTSFSTLRAQSLTEEVVAEPFGLQKAGQSVAAESGLQQTEGSSPGGSIDQRLAPAKVEEPLFQNSQTGSSHTSILPLPLSDAAVQAVQQVPSYPLYQVEPHSIQPIMPMPAPSEGHQALNEKTAEKSDQVLQVNQKEELVPPSSIVDIRLSQE